MGWMDGVSECQGVPLWGRVEATRECVSLRARFPLSRSLFTLSSSADGAAACRLSRVGRLETGVMSDSGICGCEGGVRVVREDKEEKTRPPQPLCPVTSLRRVAPSCPGLRVPNPPHSRQVEEERTMPHTQTRACAASGTTATPCAARQCPKHGRARTSLSPLLSLALTRPVAPDASASKLSLKAAMAAADRPAASILASTGAKEGGAATVDMAECVRGRGARLCERGCVEVERGARAPSLHFFLRFRCPGNSSLLPSSLPTPAAGARPRAGRPPPSSGDRLAAAAPMGSSSSSSSGTSARRRPRRRRRPTAAPRPTAARRRPDRRRRTGMADRRRLASMANRRRSSRPGRR